MATPLRIGLFGGGIVGGGVVELIKKHAPRFAALGASIEVAKICVRLAYFATITQNKNMVA
jgi:homoserine dehydrogenase